MTHFPSQSVTQENQTQNRYTGLCSTTFKERLSVHKHSFKSNDNQTALSKFVKELQKKNIKHQITWRILDRGEVFSPVTGVCWLCTKEKFYIVFHPNSADINEKDEILEGCRHVKSKLLICNNRKKKTSPG